MAIVGEAGCARDVCIGRQPAGIRSRVRRSVFAAPCSAPRPHAAGRCSIEGIVAARRGISDSAVSRGTDLEPRGRRRRIVLRQSFRRRRSDSSRRPRFARQLAASARRIRVSSHGASPAASAVAQSPARRRPARDRAPPPAHRSNSSAALRSSSTSKCGRDAGLEREALQQRLAEGVDGLDLHAAGRIQHAGEEAPRRAPAHLSLAPRARSAASRLLCSSPSGIAVHFSSCLGDADRPSPPPPPW